MRLIRGVASQSSFSGVAEHTASTFQDNPNVAAVTFSAVSIGAADTGRLVVVAFSEEGSKADSGLTATIGGVTATVTRLTNGADSAGRLYAVVPTGTTADIVFSFAGGGYRSRGVAISVFRLVGYATTPQDTKSQSGSASPSQNLTVVKNSVVIASMITDSANTNMAWTNLTEHQEVTTFTMDHSQASKLTDVVAGTVTVNPTTTGGTASETLLFATSFQPA